jgi:2-desacetyl-2-hydroxyethyl bacteriochlorophyllide A dehydrogenase
MCRRLLTLAHTTRSALLLVSDLCVSESKRRVAEGWLCQEDKAMKAIRSVDGGVSLVDVDEPPGTGELLDIKAASICASDLAYISYGSRQILGHELAGVREDGTPVVIEATYGCGTCELCRRGNYNLCPANFERALGIFADGGMAEQFRAPSERIVPIPPSLDIRDACLVEPASVSWHAFRLAGPDPGSRVAVVGAGAIGLLAVAVAQHQGSEDVAIEARHPHQLEAAARLGASTTTQGLYDVVVEAAGSEASLARCAELVAPRGAVVVAGVHLGPVRLNWTTLFNREARIIPSMSYCSHEGIREMEEAATMLADNPEIAKAVITHRFPIEDAEEAFRVAADRSAGAIRVVVEPC